MSEPRNPPSGLRVSMTEPIRSFLLSASKDGDVPRELQDLALNLSSQNNLHYKSFRSIWIRSPPSTRPPDLIRLFSGSNFILSSPKPREKSEELKARLRKLEEMAERNAYAELVKDITPRKNTDEPFSSYKDQIGFGMHVVLIMFTGYLVGFAAFRALFGHSPAMSAAGGILGLVFGMLVETLLFIIRTSNPDSRSSTSNTSKLKKNQ
ncbi:PREDICTED: uncharacterized protein LOC105128265 [Populus euphratica]|uniref:Uncharacterized protein LOC105128265 n=1 Tax=Populus euphratica TaxID=75702 RepID=A0AAJ6UDW7_POPEU|nr:PREDICTED: uncharacterized protein LOC105128265 [Populus euphratica]XP_011028162.1 PREDICTED: uncharacterized protein LOC105128265 [Populus euphratica]XP_011028163.1 PREDICTED: uncharacterized protein LOC105128265 [Populus euphratica]